MNAWAVIPAKDRRAAKSRLAAHLSPSARSILARRLLLHTLSAVTRCPALQGVMVVSSDDVLRDVASSCGVQTCADPHPHSSDPLNAALSTACQAVADAGADAVLVLPTDLPLLSRDVIEEFLDESADACVAVAPDRRGVGTNALWLRPPRAFDPLFGPDSFSAHRRRARATGRAVATVRLPALAHDLDTYADLALLGLHLGPVHGCAHG